MKTTTDEDFNPEAVIFASGWAPAQVMYFLLDNNIPHKVLLGSWEGTLEVSYLVPFDQYRNVVLGEITVGETCVLFLSKTTGLNYRHAVLRYDDGEEIPAGKFRPASKFEAESQSGWTYDPQTQSYYVID